MRERVRRYLVGRLGHVERKNSWQLAEAFGEAGPQGVQRLFTAADGEAEAVRDVLRTSVVAHLGDAASGGVVVVVGDETGFLKKGTPSAGVARQSKGPAGRRANQQIGVFLLSAAERGAALRDRALYLPDAWVGAAARPAAAHIPADVACATKGELARARVARAVGAGGPGRWGGGDTGSRADELRRWVAGQGRRCVLAGAERHGRGAPGPQQTGGPLIAGPPPDARTPVS